MQSGPFAGRLAALYADTPGGIKLIFSDYPYNNWSTPLIVTSDSSDTPFSACIDSAGNIYAVYSDTNNDLKVRKLAFLGGQWSIGGASTIINADNSYRPVILKDGDGRLWCLFDHHRVSYDGRHYVRVKNSVDDGATWGTGPADLGTALSSAWTDPVYVGACMSTSRLHAVYCVANTTLIHRICDLATSTWQAEISICEINDIADRFDAAISTDGRLGVAITPTSGGVIFKEHDGLAWGGLIEIENIEAMSPQLYYSGTTPRVVYMLHAGNGYYVPRFASMIGQVFVAEDASPSFGAFDRVFVYYLDGSPQYQDKTAAAANATADDIVHSDSQVLLKGAGDCLYLGDSAKYHRAAIVLSNIGTEGDVVWEYWDGFGWVEFVPQSGAYKFDLNDCLVQFWQDLVSAPSDWQIGAVNGYSAYWVRIMVTMEFSQSPIGTQILAGSKFEDLSLVRPAPVSNGVTI